MIINFDQIGSVGLVKDTQNELLAGDPLSWTTAQNVRFYNGSAIKLGGSEALLSSLPIQPMFYQNVHSGSSSYYCYGGTNKFYMQYSGTNYNITRQSGGSDVNYSTTADNNWHSCLLNGFPIFNNGVDIPQAWTTINTSTRLSNLAGWNATTTASVVRSFKAYLFAGDITVSSTRYPNRLWWSGAAAPGGLPTTWDYTDITQDAGYFELSDTDGPIIDMKSLGDYFLVYKNNAIYAVNYIGGSNIFSYKKTFSNIGVLSRNCIAEINNQHFVVTTDDVILTDGFNYKSVATGRIKKYLFSQINSSKMLRTFVVPNYRQNEIWVCIPSNSASNYPNTAYIYNYENNTWSTRTFFETPFINFGTVDIPSVGTYNSYTSTTFAGASFYYDSTKYNKTAFVLAAADPANSRIVLMDTTTNTEIDGSPLAVILERTNIKIAEDSAIKTIKRIWPKMTLSSGSLNSIVKFYIGIQMQKNDDISWQGPYNYNIGVDNTVDFFATGRYLSLRIQSNTDIGWSIENMDIDVFGSGKW